jgi:hypothetical protein
MILYRPAIQKLLKFFPVAFARLYNLFAYTVIPSRASMNPCSNLTFIARFCRLVWLRFSVHAAAKFSLLLNATSLGLQNLAACRCGRVVSLLSLLSPISIVMIALCPPLLFRCALASLAALAPAWTYLQLISIMDTFNLGVVLPQQ